MKNKLDKTQTELSNRKANMHFSSSYIIYIIDYRKLED